MHHEAAALQSRLAELQSELQTQTANQQARVEELERCMCVEGSQPRSAEPFAAEEAERQAYRDELERLREYVSMGEGI